MSAAAANATARTDDPTLMHTSIVPRLGRHAILRAVCARRQRAERLGVAQPDATRDDRDVAVDGSIPHPLLFDRPRAVFGGPSFFTVKQSVVTGIALLSRWVHLCALP
jgi:hypothetical protein